MKFVVRKNCLGGQIVYISLARPIKNGVLAFTVDKRQRNAEAASPELRKEAILSNTVRRAHQMLSLFDPRRRNSNGFGEDELVDVDDELSEQNIEHLVSTVVTL